MIVICLTVFIPLKECGEVSYNALFADNFSCSLIKQLEVLTITRRSLQKNW